MGSGITQTDKMMSVREAPWHLGVETTEEQVTVLSEYQGRERSMEAAGHNWQVIRQEVYVARDGGIVALPEWKALTRDDDGSVLHIASDSYEPIQNEVLWDIVDALLDQPKVRYETAGTLNGGRKLWVLATLDEPQQVPGDGSAIVPYICCLTSHDGTGALKALRTAVRVVCRNTADMALAESARTGREFTFRHTGAVRDRIAEARDLLLGTRRQFSDFMDLAFELASESITMDQVDRFLAEFIPSPPEFEISEPVKANIAKARAGVKRILEGPTCEGIAGTKWGLFNAGVEYLDYERSYRNPETLLGRTLLRPEPLKQKLVRLVKRI